MTEKDKNYHAIDGAVQHALDMACRRIVNTFGGKKSDCGTPGELTQATATLAAALFPALLQISKAESEKTPQKTLE